MASAARIPEALPRCRIRARYDPDAVLRAKEEQMRRSFKVATAFTGVAALAGGAGPTALAATTQHVLPAFKVQQCGANNGGVSNWVHLYYPNDDHPAECIAGPAHSNPVNATIYSFCPGNNFGQFFGSFDGIKNVGPFPFGAGSPRAHIGNWAQASGIQFTPFHISRITIAGDSGHARCT